MNLPLSKSVATGFAVRSSRLLLIAASCLLAVPLVLRAAAPGWWTERGVIDASLTAKDFAAVNQGQVKNLARQAMEELDAHLPGGGVGEAVHAMVEGWDAPTAATSDFSLVNLGALKTLAKPFYERLIEVGYTEAFPWAGKQVLVNDFAAANIGQAKNLFAFDVTLDGDHNGLPDWWEQHWFGHTGVNPADEVAWGPVTILQAYQQGLNPLDYYHGHQPAMAIAGGNGQTGAPGNFVYLPLVVSMTDAASGAVLMGAPITFTVDQAGGTVQKTSHGVAVATLKVLTDAGGQARVYFRLPGGGPATCHVTASAGGAAAATDPVFTEHAVSGPGPGGGSGGGSNPFAPTNIVSTLNADGSGTVTWTNNPDNDDPDPINIREKDARGRWRVIATAPAGATSCNFSRW